MLGKIIGAVVGKGAARHVSSVGGTQGALLGAAVPVLLRRLGPLGLLAAAAGGYMLKRRNDRRQAAGLPR